MGELSKIIAGLDSLTVEETDELARLLTDRAQMRARVKAIAIESEEDAEAWLIAELIALQREATRLADSLEASEARIAAQCAVLMSAS